MAKKFLTGIDLNKNELLNASIQNLANNPVSPVSGQIYYNSVDGTIRYWTGTVWNVLANGSTITTAINALTSSDIEEGTNLYFTDERAVAAVGGSATSANTPNTVVKRNASGNFAAGQITAENLVTDNISSTTDLTVQASAILTLGGVGINVVAPSGNIVLDAATGGAYLTSASADNKIATHGYVDSAISGLNWKESAHLFAKTINIPLTGSTGTVVIDSHAALTSSATGYRLLLTGQTTSSQNGIYIYTDNGSTYTLSRATDADSVGELLGAAIFVMEGTVYGSTSWVQSNTYAVTFADLTWTQFSGTGAVTAGEGISIDGTAVSIDRTTVDTWYDAAGAAASAVSALSFPKKYTETNLSITPSSGIATWTISAATHGIGSLGSIIVQMKEVSGAVVDADISVNESTGAIVISWNSATTVTAGTYRITAIG